jgi:hypothetical protein
MNMRFAAAPVSITALGVALRGEVQTRDRWSWTNLRQGFIAGNLPVVCKRQAY